MMFHHEKILGKTGKQSCLRKKFCFYVFYFLKSIFKEGLNRKKVLLN